MKEKIVITPLISSHIISFLDNPTFTTYSESNNIAKKNVTPAIIVTKILISVALLGLKILAITRAKWQTVIPDIKKDTIMNPPL